MHGECLCGQVKFEIIGDIPKLYQCHCSLCRKQGGAAANAATIVAADDFRWIGGEESIRSWVKDTGFRSDFCSNCGSPVPNPLKNCAYFWVPAGLLDANAKLEVGAQLFVASKAVWDTVTSPGVNYETMPELSELLELLHAKTPA
jgi:hypothetical protein